MEIIDAEYLISSPSVDLCPAPEKPEYAFIGRSNVGKSSVINMLCNKKEVAKVSSSPGKTQMINHFLIKSNNRTEWYLVDLPGYGFAKVSQQQRKQWQKMIENYIRTRPNLMNLFVLIDSRVQPQELDLKFINQLGEWGVPFSLVFTKADKITQREVAKNVKTFLDVLSETWEQLPPYFVTSAVKFLGAKQLRNFIGEVNNQFNRKK